MQGIDSNWNLWNLAVAFAPIHGAHTAEAVGKLIAGALTPFLGIIKGFEWRVLSSLRFFTYFYFIVDVEYSR